MFRLRHASPGRGLERVLVGRAQELAALRECLAEALAGRGRVVVLVGEAGIGKTRLADELAIEARGQRARVLTARCDEGEGTPPYWLWTQILRGYLSEAASEASSTDLGVFAPAIAQAIPDVRERWPDVPPGALDDSEHACFRFFDGLTRFLTTASGHEPLVLILDDLHWADTPSLRLLGFVARAIPAARVLLIGAYRDTGLARQHPLVQALGEILRAPGSVSLHVRGLSAADIARYFEAITGETPAEAFVRRVSIETGGNPFFLGEVARLLMAESRVADGLTLPIPLGVRAVVARRLQALSASCQEMLALAAVLGREFGTGTLEAVGAALKLGPTGDWLLDLLEEAVDAGIIVAVQSKVRHFAFAHALMREALYEDLNPVHRSRLHRQIAETLEDASDLRAHAALGEPAYHFFQAAQGGGDADKAVAYAAEAGEWAMRVLAWEEAVLHYRRALAVIDMAAEPDDAQRGEMVLRLGQVLSKAGEVTPAQECFEQAVALGRRLQSPTLLARAVLGMGGEWLAETGVVDQRYTALLEEVVERLNDGDSIPRAQLLSRLSIALYYAPGSRARRIELSRQAVEMARRLGDAATLAWALHAEHWTLWDPAHLAEREVVATELVRVADDIGARDLALQGRAWRVSTLLERGDIEAVDREIEAYARAADETRQPVFQWWTPMFRAMRASLDGRFADQERLAEEGLRMGQRVQSQFAVQIFGTHLLTIRRVQGRLAEIEAAVTGLVAQHPTELNWRSTLTFVYAELGRMEEARQEFERIAAHDFADLAEDRRWMPIMAMLGQVCAVLGDQRRAAILYGLLEPYAGRVIVAAAGAGMCLGGLSRSLGLLAGIVGRQEESERHFADALALHVRMGARTWVALTLYDHAFILLRRGDAGERSRAEKLAAQALATARELGMSGLLEKIRLLGLGDDGRLPARSPAEQQPAGPTAGAKGQGNVFHRDGEYWTIVYLWRVCRLKDAKGLHYVAALVRQPDRELHVLDLSALTDPPPPPPPGASAGPGGLEAQSLRVGTVGGGGDRLDAQARQAYKRRLGELQAELDEAALLDDPERAERARSEMEFVGRELGAAYGLGGRARQSPGDNEQIRKNVTNSIRRSLGQIAKAHPALGRHLLTAVRTGIFCSYRPEQPVAWDS